VVREVFGVLFERDEHAVLAVLGGASHEKIGRKEGLAAAGGAAHQRWTSAWQAATGDFVDPFDSSGRLGQRVVRPNRRTAHQLLALGGHGGWMLTALGRVEHGLRLK